jgi:hypothetical protein
VAHIEQTAFIEPSRYLHYLSHKNVDLLSVGLDELWETLGVGGQREYHVETHVDLLRLVQDLEEHDQDLVQTL